MTRSRAHQRVCETLYLEGRVSTKINGAFQSGFKIVTLKDKRTPFTVDILSDKKLKERSGTIFDLPIFYQIPEDLVPSKLSMIRAMISRERA